MRRASQEDAEILATFNARVFRNFETGAPDEAAAGWVHDLMRGDHPTFRPGDFLLVEDTAEKAIVSSLCLISQVWSYGGISFGVGRPELVGTREDYRRRGLVRSLFAELHRISAERGELMQVITGIPWYYRQFGYELALESGGGRSGFKPQVPRLAPGVAEPYNLRPAASEDVPFVAGLYAQAGECYRVMTEFGAELWPYELTGRTDASDMRPVWLVIETPAGAPVGVLRHANRLWGTAIGVNFYEIERGLSWNDVTPSVLRYLESKGEEYAAAKGVTWSEFRFALRDGHPVYAALGSRLPAVRRSGAWYVRIPDLPAFLQRVAPALERQLAASAFAGHSGELRISSYRDGVRLRFAGGRLAEVAHWQPGDIEDGDLLFPGHTFLQLLLGYRSLEELRYAFADCVAAGETATALASGLFPRQPSLALGVA